MAPEASVQERRPRALAEIGLNTIKTNDISTSSDEDVSRDVDKQDAPDVQSIVGISLGPEQLRLTSPTTPAIEKSKAIAEGGGFFGAIPLGSLDEAVEGAEDNQVGPEVSAETGPYSPLERSRGRDDKVSAGPQARLPSPWRAGAKTFQRTDLTRPFFSDMSRRRASSGASLSAAFEHWQKTLMSSLPSLPKSLGVSYPFSSSKASTGQATAGSSIQQENSRSTGNISTLPSSLSRGTVSRTRSRSDAAAVGLSRQEIVADQSSPTSPATSLSRPTPSRARSSYLRRSASDQSLQLHRVMSRASTLGDDSRFEHISEQVNSRMKAIRDSFQDSNIRVPSLPSLPNFSLESLKPDFNYSYSSKNGFQRKPASPTLRPRNGSASPRRSSALPPSSYQSSKDARPPGERKEGGPTAKGASLHPHFAKACADLTGDLVVLGGYRGSILRSAEPPNRQLWVPVKVGLNIRKVDLEVGLNIPEDDAKMSSKIIPDGMLTHIGPVDISRRLFRRLRACENVQSGQLRVHDYGYDWRLDPEYLSGRFIEYLEKLPCNRPGTSPSSRGATVIAHSLGGLITRHAINRRPDLFAGVVYAGTPTTCVNILGPLRKGDDVLLSSRVLTAQVNFSIRTSFALLPLDGKCFFNKETKEHFPVDFFDPQTWIDHRLSPCVGGRPLPALDPPPAGMLDSLMSSISSLPKRASLSAERSGLEPADMDPEPSSSSVATAVSLPRDACVEYLTTCLARVKRFKLALAFMSEHKEANAYPPAAVIYGKSTPTVYGAKVKSSEAIKRADAYDELAFGSGDGVVLARAAMLPDGYEVARGGVVSSERGHITLLGDLEAVGKALNAVRRARTKGVGLGNA